MLDPINVESHKFGSSENFLKAYGLYQLDERIQMNPRVKIDALLR